MYVHDSITGDVDRATDQICVMMTFDERYYHGMSYGLILSANRHSNNTPNQSSVNELSRLYSIFHKIANKSQGNALLHNIYGHPRWETVGN